MAKVSWDRLVLLKKLGGLGLIDLEMQYEAVLGKLLV